MKLWRPLLSGQDTRMLDYLDLVSSLGGLTVGGATGLVMGPILAAMILAVWDMLAQAHRADSAAEATDAARNSGEASAA